MTGAEYEHERIAKAMVSAATVSGESMDHTHCSFPRILTPSRNLGVFRRD